MQSIELTPEHKKKLLKMIKVLFPENYLDKDDSYIDDKGILNLWNPTKKKNNWKGVEIHWFEFAIKQLNNKIAELTTNDSYFIEDILLSNEHPIDWLYSEFLKLKL